MFGWVGRGARPGVPLKVEPASPKGWRGDPRCHVRAPLSEDAPMTVRGTPPAQTTTFIGRRAVLADAETLLAQARLVSIIGADGVGKSRIAVETGRAMV